MNIIDFLYFMVPLFAFAALVEMVHFFPFAKVITDKEVYERLIPMSTPFLFSFLVFEFSFIAELFFENVVLHRLFEILAMMIVLLTTAVMVRRNLTELQITRATKSVVERSQKKYKGLIEKMNDGFWAIDENGTTTMVNHKMCEMLGYQRKELLGTDVMDFFSEKEQIKLKKQLQMRPKGIASTYEINITKKDGSLLPVIASAAPIFDDEGKFEGSFAIVTDISKIKGMEEQLKNYSINLEKMVANRTKDLVKARDSLMNILEDLTNSKRELAEAYDELKDIDRLKTDIISNISHELRTPITIAKSSIELTKGETNRKEINMFLGMCENALDRLNDIIENLVDISTIYKGSFVASAKTVDIDKALKTVLSHFKMPLEGKKIKISYSPKGALPKIRGDEKVILRVLTNLVDNAIKFNHPGGEIKISTKKRGGHIQVIIRDHGDWDTF